MGVRRAGIGTLSVAAATVACGLLLLGGVAPSRGLPGDEPIPPPGSGPSDDDDQGGDDQGGDDQGGDDQGGDDQGGDEQGDDDQGDDPDDGYDTTTTAPVTAPPTTETTVATTSTTTSPSTSTSVPMPTSTTSTTTSSTTSTSVATAPPPVPVPVPPLPLSIGQSTTIVGAGGTVDFDGTCPVVARDPLGPLVVDIISVDAERLDTGITAERWVYEWTAPTEPDEIATHTFQFWCGDPTTYRGGYPLDLQRTVDVVAQAAAVTTTTTVPASGGSPPTGTIPSTG